MSSHSHHDSCLHADCISFLENALPEEGDRGQYVLWIGLANQVLPLSGSTVSFDHRCKTLFYKLVLSRPVAQHLLSWGSEGWHMMLAPEPFTLQFKCFGSVTQAEPPGPTVKTKLV